MRFADPIFFCDLQICDLRTHFFAVLKIPKNSAEQGCSLVLGVYHERDGLLKEVFHPLRPVVKRYAISGLAHLRNLRTRDLQINSKVQNFLSP
jgi:hypothetical protein